MMSRETPLRFRPIAVAVVRAARRHAWRILAVSIVVSAVTVAVELAADHLLSRSSLATALIGSLSTSTVSLLGAVFLSGFLCRLVSDTEHGGAGHGDTGHSDTGHGGGDSGHSDTGQGGGGTGHENTGHENTEHENTGHSDTGDWGGGAGHENAGHGTRIRDVLASLPWGALILADLLAAVIILVGLVALIIPGLVAITLLAVVGPVIEIERQHAVAGLRRSAHLVRPHFWRVAAFGTLPLLLSNGIVAFLPDPSGTTNVVTTLIVRSIGEGIVESVVGLILVELCYRLIAADPGGSGRRSHPSAAAGAARG